MEWDEWEPIEIEIGLNFEADPKRPSYHPDTARNEMNLDQVAIGDIGITIDLDYQQDLVDLLEGERFGLADGRNHNDRGEENPSQNFPQCYLFHEIFDHKKVGLEGMLQLSEIYFDVQLRQSGRFWLAEPVVTFHEDSSNINLINRQ